MTEPNKSLDVLGIKPIANAVESVTTGAVSGASAFLSRICLPAAEEFGLLLRDRVSAWRAKNAAVIVNEAERLVSENVADAPLHAHPRIVADVIELGSWSDTEEVQQMWAGLLASACSPDGRDDSNLMFLNVLSTLTVAQTRIFDAICKKCVKKASPGGWIISDRQSMTLDEIRSIAGLTDAHRIDLEILHLRAVSLLVSDAGFHDKDNEADVTPTAFALQMFVRCQGSASDPITFYGVQLEKNNDHNG